MSKEDLSRPPEQRLRPARDANVGSNEGSTPTRVSPRPESEIRVGVIDAEHSEIAPRRICLVAPSLDILGGQAVQANRFLKHLEHTPGVIAEFVPHNPRLPGILRQLQKIKYVRTVLTTVAYVALLFRRVRCCEVVHTFSASYFSYVVAPLPALLIGRLFGKRTVLNYRSGELEQHLRRWPGITFTMRLADAIVSPSPYLVEVFEKFGLRAQTIPNYLDLEPFTYSERLPPRPIFLVNRLFEPHYNHDCALRAFSLIQNEIPDARLIIAGYGSQESYIHQRIIHLGLRNVALVGRVSPARMRQLYHEADIYLNTPDLDCFPGSILEAFASGAPVITTAAGGIPYLVEDGKTGLVAKCGDAENLARLALSLFREPGQAVRLARAARDVVSRKYTWAAIAPQWMALYDSLLGQAS